MYGPTNETTRMIAQDTNGSIDSLILAQYNWQMTWLGTGPAFLIRDTTDGLRWASIASRKCYQ